MFQIWQLLFPKLYFGIDDLANGGGAPDPGQPDPDPGNDPNQNPDPAAPNPTDFIDVKGVKIPASEFEALAKEKYKDRFEAFDNREKWQAENTRKAQENAQIQRDADAYRRMMADPRFSQPQAQPRNEFESMKEDYIREKSEFYPDADPQKLRAFLGKEFELHAKLAGFKAQETVRPFQDQQAMDFEEKFLAAHPKVQRGTPQYEEIRDLVGSGVKPEKAYQIVFFDDLVKERELEAIKRRDEEAKRKLQQSRQNSTQGERLSGKTRSDRIWAAIEKHGT